MLKVTRRFMAFVTFASFLVHGNFTFGQKVDSARQADSAMVGVVKNPFPWMALGEELNEREPSPTRQLTRLLQTRMVKIYGAGGMRGLESYQSGFFVSDNGHIATSWSTVLDVSVIRVTTYDGKRLEAEIVGSDPETEIAILKVDMPSFDYFKLDPKTAVDAGTRVFGLSNLFGIATGDEPVSIQQGVVMAVAPLSARRARLKTVYQGRVLVLDVMTNNPGATGGALVDLNGNLVGMLGKELRDEQTNIWLNYALPIDVVSASIRRILEGKTSLVVSPDELRRANRPHELSVIGLSLIPNVLPKTPPFVDYVTPRSLADRAGFQVNDLVLLVNNQRVDSRKTLEEILSTIERVDPFEALVQRGDELIRIEIRP